MHTLNLRPRLDARDPETLALLAHAAYPDPARLEAAAARYAERGWRLLGLADDSGALLGLIGLDESGPQHTVITHIAVAPQARGLGLGRRLLRLAGEGAPLYAETDASAVEFYRACGFTVTSLGKVYAGTERFACLRSVGLPF